MTTIVLEQMLGPITKFTANVKDYGAKGDGVTNDTAAIQAALDSGNAVVFIPAGNYLMGALTIPSTVHVLYGQGIASTQLTATGAISAFTPVMYFNGISALEVFGLKLNFNHTTYAQNTAMHFGNCSDVYVHNNYLAEGGYIGMYFPNCQRVTARDNIVGITALYMFHADSGCNDIIATHNRFISAPVSGHVLHIGAGSGHIIDGNRIDNTAFGNFGIAVNGGAFESTVVNNIIRTKYLEGIQITDSYRVTVQNNHILCDSTNHTDMGISLSAETADVFDCLVVGNHIQACGTTGIGLASDSRIGTKQCFRNVVADNKIFNPNQRNSGAAGVWIYGTLSTSNTVRDNEVDDQAAHVQYGVKEYNNGDGNPNANLFIHNNLRSGARVADALTLGGSSVIKAL